MKLTKTQRRALPKLSQVWRQAPYMGERTATLLALVERGLADVYIGTMAGKRLPPYFRAHRP